MLEKLHQQEQAQLAAAGQGGGEQAKATPASRLLSSHPDHHTRLHHLREYLQPSR
ncbi:hypothetical protein ACH4KU_31180 [Streptomyces althioticus]|uniref:hypothetical protein n=1 Tax=Streptomyces TaxID=1883 RepID=UPI0033CEA42F